MIKRILNWSILATFIGITAGFTSWSFNYCLKFAIEARETNPWSIYFLPFVGSIVAWLYVKFGSEIDAGNNLVIDEIHQPQKHIAFRMVPMIFISSTLSHLFGASVGREGAAVQMGAGIADQFNKFVGKFFNNRKIILMMGMSAGFSSLFGAPIAGTIFGMEILFLGSLTYEALFPCLLSSTVGFFTSAYLGIEHMPLAVGDIPHLHPKTVLAALFLGAVCGVIAKFFLWLLHWFKNILAQKFSNPIIRPMIGGGMMIVFYLLINSDRYLNLGEKYIIQSFNQIMYPWDFLGKITSTVISVGAGFRGGEVMSLFYIGATLGNTLSYLVPLAQPICAALGFVAVFAGAVNTPLTAIFLAVEYFGGAISIYAALAVVMSYLISGHEGLYNSQRKHLLTKI
jgi:H+/Cl- antiporter ClcA